MADKKISQLTANTNPSGGEELVYAYNNTNGKMSLNTMKTFVENNLSGYATTADLASKQDTLVSGTNIKTINGTSILGSGNIDIQGGGQARYDYSAMRGPAPAGYHIPTYKEWQDIYAIWTGLGGGASDGTNFGKYLKMPTAGYRNPTSSDITNQGNHGVYWMCTANYRVRWTSTTLSSKYSTTDRTLGASIRCIKDVPSIPDINWTKLYGTSIEEGGIFWTSGLISLSSDGETWITIADKNLGATVVWNDGDALSESNCGYYYQRGNNNGFAFTGAVTTSTSQVDASSYGPGNYYSSSTFIMRNGDWSNPSNDNLWGAVTGPIPHTEGGVTELTADANIWELSEGTYVTTYDLYYKTGNSVERYTTAGAIFRQRIDIIVLSNGVRGYFVFNEGKKNTSHRTRIGYGYSESSSVGVFYRMGTWDSALLYYEPAAGQTTSIEPIDNSSGMTQIINNAHGTSTLSVSYAYPGTTYTIIINSVAGGETYTVTTDASVSNPLNITLPSASTKPCVITLVASAVNLAIITGCTIGS